MNLTPEQITQRINHNTRLALNAINSGQSIFCILPFVQVVDYDGPLHGNRIIRNINDIIPAIMLGLLPAVARHGYDAVAVENDEIVEYELKISSFKAQQVWAGSQGALYIGLENIPARRGRLASYLCGSFNISSDDCLQSKNRRTVLLIANESLPPDELFVDAYELSGNVVMKYLNKSSSRTRNIKLSAFLNYGKPKTGIVPFIGWHQHQSDLENIVECYDDWKYHQGADYFVEKLWLSDTKQQELALNSA
jgi:hypothetical protein